MAKGSAEQGKVVAEWAKAQAASEAASEAADAARKVAQTYAKVLYEAFGTEPFSVKALGRDYRAIHKKGGLNKNGTMLQETFAVIPLAQNTPTREF
jgi:hypothetical protein